MRWKQACVCGKPCKSTSGGPLPPERAKTRPASPSIQCDAKPGKRSSVMRSGSGPPRRHDISPGEVVTLEEERQAAGLREGVGEAVGEVEASGMQAFAVTNECSPCLDCFGAADSFDLDP